MKKIIIILGLFFLANTIYAQNKNTEYKKYRKEVLNELNKLNKNYIHISNNEDQLDLYIYENEKIFIVLENGKRKKGKLNVVDNNTLIVNNDTLKLSSIKKVGYYLHKNQKGINTALGISLSVTAIGATMIGVSILNNNNLQAAGYTMLSFIPALTSIILAANKGSKLVLPRSKYKYSIVYR